jgi:SAM-dependent methyltransferase
MPFPIYLPFYPGHAPHRIFSRESAVADYPAYVALADAMTTAQVFPREVPADGPVLDAGCGGGRWVIRLREGGRAMVGLDVHPPVLLALRPMAHGAPLVAGAVDALPFRGGALAAVISLGVVEHDERGPDAALREFARVLRPGGRLLVSVPFNNPVRRMVINQWYRWYNTRWAGRGYYFVEYRYTRGELLAALRRAGFTPRTCHAHEFLWPRNMGMVADLNMLNFRLGPDGQLRFPPDRNWRLDGWRAIAVRCLQRLSPWLVAAEILVVAEKTAGP